MIFHANSLLIISKMIQKSSFWPHQSWINRLIKVGLVLAKYNLYLFLAGKKCTESMVRLFSSSRHRRNTPQNQSCRCRSDHIRHHPRQKRKDPAHQSWSASRHSD